MVTLVTVLPLPLMKMPEPEFVPRGSAWPPKPALTALP